MLIYSLLQVVKVVYCGPTAALWRSQAVTESAELPRGVLPACGRSAVPSGAGPQPSTPWALSQLP